jgi:hypothetical protein
MVEWGAGGGAGWESSLGASKADCLLEDVSINLAWEKKNSGHSLRQTVCMGANS